MLGGDTISFYCNFHVSVSMAVTGVDSSPRSSNHLFLDEQQHKLIQLSFIPPTGVWLRTRNCSRPVDRTWQHQRTHSECNSGVKEKAVCSQLLRELGRLCRRVRWNTGVSTESWPGWRNAVREKKVIAWRRASARKVSCSFVSRRSITLINPFPPTFKEYILPTFLKRNVEVMRIVSIIFFHLSKLWKVKFSILCDVIFLVRLQGKFEIDHSAEQRRPHLRVRWSDQDFQNEVADVRQVVKHPWNERGSSSSHFTIYSAHRNPPLTHELGAELQAQHKEIQRLGNDDHVLRRLARVLSVHDSSPSPGSGLGFGG